MTIDDQNSEDPNAEQPVQSGPAVEPTPEAVIDVNVPAEAPVPYEQAISVTVEGGEQNLGGNLTLEFRPKFRTD